MKLAVDPEGMPVACKVIGVEAFPAGGFGRPTGYEAVLPFTTTCDTGLKKKGPEKSFGAVKLSVKVLTSPAATVCVAAGVTLARVNVLGLPENEIV